jgi:23S rRNA (adenine-N6)-dimethyltransferase
VGRRRTTARDSRRRSHGQNFLVDRALVRRLVADVEPGSRVVDLGAGTGTLTLAAARAGASVLAVEVDPVWAGKLRTAAAEQGLADRVDVVHGDLRTVRLPRPPWRVLASPPFGHTTAVLERLLDDPDAGPERADLVLQWEVARKRAAQPPTTLRSAGWAPWWDLELRERVPRAAFRPVPAVDAGWLRITQRRPPLLPSRLAPAWAAFLERNW